MDTHHPTCTCATCTHLTYLMSKEQFWINLMRRFGCRYGLAMDLIPEAYFKAWKARQKESACWKGAGSGNIDSWFGTILRHEFLTYLRRQEVRDNKHKEYVRRLESMSMVMPDVIIEQEQTYAALWYWINGMPQKYRDAIIEWMMRDGPMARGSGGSSSKFKVRVVYAKRYLKLCAEAGKRVQWTGRAMRVMGAGSGN